MLELHVLNLQAAEACGTLEIDSALDTVGSLGRDLEAYEKSAEEGKLLPLPGDTVSCQTTFWTKFFNSVLVLPCDTFWDL